MKILVTTIAVASAAAFMLPAPTAAASSLADSCVGQNRSPILVQNSYNRRYVWCHSENQSKVQVDRYLVDQSGDAEFDRSADLACTDRRVPNQVEQLATSCP